MSKVKTTDLSKTEGKVLRYVVSRERNTVADDPSVTPDMCVVNRVMTPGCDLPKSKFQAQKALEGLRSKDLVQRSETAKGGYRPLNAGKELVARENKSVVWD